MYQGIKIAAVIPTRDRPRFLTNALRLIARQSTIPDIIEIVDDTLPATSIGRDITLRYRLGCQRAFERGAKVVLCWEDDDWYAPDYIQTMLVNWLSANQPPIFGLNFTVYYHIGRKAWSLLEHPGRASMMSTLIDKSVLNGSWSASTAFLDLYLWEKHKGQAIGLSRTINIGIKHGIGICAGVGHNKNFLYDHQDEDYQFLRNILGSDEESLKFYKGIAQ
ncbi:MAG: hypothetical protein QME51_01945 [Planctomycetota bacterium]|nr:hypothetical protein [Planctomycetota bacterium]